MTLEVDNLKSTDSGNSDSVDNFIDGRAKAWGRFNQTLGGHPLVGNSFNVSSTVDAGFGETDIAHTNGFTDEADAHPNAICTSAGDTVSKSASSSSATTTELNAADSGGSLTDNIVIFAIHGTLA